MLRDLRGYLQDNGLLTQVPWAASMLGRVTPVGNAGEAGEQLPLMDATWMDDLSIVVRSASAEELPHRTSRVTGALLDQCLSRGLRPYLAKGKTEILMVPCGRGSRAVRATSFRDRDPVLRVDSSHLGQTAVRLMPQYRHLGGLIHHSGKVLKEVRYRISLAHEGLPTPQAACVSGRRLLHSRLRRFCMSRSSSPSSCMVPVHGWRSIRRLFRLLSMHMS